MIFKGSETTCGSDSKGDVLVTLELTDKNGINIDIKSKAISKYGSSIKKSVVEVLNDLNILNANVLIEDYGALDFVIRARVETAAQRSLYVVEGKQ